MLSARRWTISVAGTALAILAAVAPAGAEDAPPAVVSDGGPRTSTLWDGFDAAGAPEPSGAVTVIDTSKKSAVTAAYLNRLIPAEKVQPNWRGSVGACNPGTESLRSRLATVSALNFFRSMAGLGPVVRNESYEDEARKAALMMDAANTLNHFPVKSPGWPCWFESGRIAAGVSNLALGITGAASIEGYFDEPGVNNRAVGHRRWFLYAPLRKVGIGSTSGANTIRVIESVEGGRGLWGTPLRKPAWVSWPRKGYIPWELLPTDRSALPPYAELRNKLHRWSLASPKFSKADFSNATVTMTMNGTPLLVTKEPYDPRFADNTLVWSARRRDGSAFPMSTDAAIRVVVSGIRGGPSSRYAYTVKPYPLGPPSAPDAKQPGLNGRTFIAKWGPARANGTPITGYVVRLYSNGKFITKRVGPAARSASFSGLTVGRQYCFYVAADSKAGMSPYDNPTFNCWTIR